LNERKYGETTMRENKKQASHLEKKKPNPSRALGKILSLKTPLFTLKKDLKIIQPLETSMMHALTQSTT
jgi:hypothetical protein